MNRISKEKVEILAFRKRFPLNYKALKLLYIKENKITVNEIVFFEQRDSVEALVRILTVTWYYTKLDFVRSFGHHVARWKIQSAGS